MTSLYRFYSNAAHTLDGLANNYLWFSKLSDFNDPFEGIYIHQYNDIDRNTLDNAQMTRLYKSVHKNMLPEKELNEKIIELIVKNKLRDESFTFLNKIKDKIDEVSSQFINDMYYCCLIDGYVNEGEPHPLKNKLMWSHYCDGFRGFCIEYDKDSLIESLGKIGNQTVGIIKIAYEKLVKYDIAELLIASSENIGDGVGKLLTLKSPEWSYENEFRLSMDIGSVNHYDFSCIKSIIFSEKMPVYRVQTILNILDKLSKDSGHYPNIKEVYIDKISLELNIRER